MHKSVMRKENFPQNFRVLILEKVNYGAITSAKAGFPDLATTSHPVPTVMGNQNR